jgi:hypothetical protein
MLIHGFIISGHACNRAIERFNSLDVFNQLDETRQAGKKVRKQIKSQCPIMAAQYMDGFKGRYYLYNNSTKMVFVIQSTSADKSHIVCTVFNLTEKV